MDLPDRRTFVSATNPMVRNLKTNKTQDNSFILMVRMVLSVSRALSVLTELAEAG